MNIAAWLHSVWPRPQQRQALAGEYSRLGTCKLVLADIALRGGVFTPRLEAKDLFEAGVNEGRRQLALETIRIAGIDAASLQQICTTPSGDMTHARPQPRPFRDL